MWLVGADFYGKVDRVPRVCHVRTRFLHVMCFPFVPTGSYLILEPRDADEQVLSTGPSFKRAGTLLIAEAQSPSGCASAHRIRLSIKSVVCAWLRALLVVMIMSCWGMAFEIFFADGQGPNAGKTSLAVIGLAFGTVLCGLYCLTLPASRPGSARREYLTSLASKARALAESLDEAGEP